MGQSKHNPIAQLAKAGKLPPKKRKSGKRETEKFLMGALHSAFVRKLYQHCNGHK